MGGGEEPGLVRVQWCFVIPANCFSKTCETSETHGVLHGNGVDLSGGFLFLQVGDLAQLACCHWADLRKEWPQESGFGICLGFCRPVWDCFLRRWWVPGVRNCTVFGNFWAAHASVPSAGPGQYQVWLWFSTAALPARICSGARTRTVLSSVLGDCWTHQGALCFSCWPEERGSALCTDQSGGKKASPGQLHGWDPWV